ncbi:hypothetical protein H072_5774 [Dactylellina haptotyla CBS 200.50]|uniref:Indoleamine 2,3-dioxygenase n=1 Tax=Dactylellina haptotyla (strain CBS 200.50) TaxID=1284197 RepID=S8ABR7_DACHA|nr:hypothetical protein H072_5774 [Dactylellina haptotyla CBS 200.50]
MEFEILTENSLQDNTLPAFMVSTTRGFLPRIEPPTVLPTEFDVLEQLLQDMPIRKASGEPGLLATGRLGATVDTSFPNLVEKVEHFKDDQPILNALYRDYSFLLSAYLFEPCYLKYLETEGTEYGLGRSILPRSIAQPMARVAELTGFQPFMEYAGSYALYNYKLLEPSKGMEYDNLALIRAFEHGLDNKSSEAGFVLIHVAMVRHSGKLVQGVQSALKGLIAPTDAAGKMELFQNGLQDILESMKQINKVMDEMWQKSKPEKYSQFRVFIFGIHSQPMFPDGVIYEGVSKEPMKFRGESGANDSMIPLVDNFMCIDMPENPLTDILKDFRKYRPGNHKAFLSWVEEIARGNPSVKEFALRDQKSAILYLLILDQIREFRGRHWSFTREYILKQGKKLHPKATGGSPIVEWLPNQLTRVLNLMTEVQLHISKTHIDHLKGGDLEEFERICEIIPRHSSSLEKEVKRYTDTLASQ